MINLFAIVLVGYLSFNPTLESVGYTRQTQPTKHNIPEEINIEDYRCHIGVQYGYGHLIGKEAYFVSDRVYGPFLITDVESKDHYPHMKENNLVADINCEDIVHKKGYILVSGYSLRTDTK